GRWRSVQRQRASRSPRRSLSLPRGYRRDEPDRSTHVTLIGYARVSTRAQDLALQLDALEQAGCERVYKDVGSGTIRRRPQLDACLDYLRAGDTLVVWRLDRLGRSLRHLVELVGDLEEREIAFRS